MRILITNVQLDHRTGTEIVVRDLESGLSPAAIRCASTRRPVESSATRSPRRGGMVVDALDRVPFVPDVIHTHHNGPATDAALHFPSTPLVFVCHSRHYWLDMAQGVPSVREYVAVDLSCPRAPSLGRCAPGLGSPRHQRGRPRSPRYARPSVSATAPGNGLRQQQRQLAASRRKCARASADAGALAGRVRQRCRANAREPGASSRRLRRGVRQGALRHRGAGCWVRGDRHRRGRLRRIGHVG